MIFGQDPHLLLLRVETFSCCFLIGMGVEFKGDGGTDGGRELMGVRYDFLL